MTIKNPKIGAKTFMMKKEMDGLKAEYKKLNRARREALRQFLQKVAVLSASLAELPQTVAQLAECGMIEKRKGISTVQSILKYAMSREGCSPSKVVAKHARVIAFLLDNEKVAPSDIAAEIRERGGIEKISKQAALCDPRKRGARKPHKMKAEIRAMIPKRKADSYSSLINSLKEGQKVRLTLIKAKDGRTMQATRLKIVQSAAG